MSETKSFSTCKKEELYDQLLTSIDREILGERGKTLEEQWEAFKRGDYGPPSIMALVVSFHSHGESVEHLRGEYPDLFLDHFAECMKKSEEERRAEKKERV